MGAPRKGPPPAQSLKAHVLSRPPAVAGPSGSQGPRLPAAVPSELFGSGNCCSLESVFLRSMSAAWVAGAGLVIPGLMSPECGGRKLVPLLRGQRLGQGRGAPLAD